MDWEALGAVAELAGAIGVIVSLLYLAVQIRQNTRSVRMTAHHALMSEYRANIRVFAQDPEFAQAFQTGLEHPEQLSEGDRVRFGSMVASGIQIYEELYAHYCAGLIECDLWESRQRNLSFLMSLPGVLAWWRGEANLLPGRRGSDQVSEEFKRLVSGFLRADDTAVTHEKDVASQADTGGKS